MNEDEILKDEERLLLDELLRLSRRRAQTGVRARLADNHRVACRRALRRHGSYAGLLLPFLLLAAGLLTAHAFPYVMNVPSGTSREAVNLLVDQIIAMP